MYTELALIIGIIIMGVANWEDYILVINDPTPYLSGNKELYSYRLDPVNFFLISSYQMLTII